MVENGLEIGTRVAEEVYLGGYKSSLGDGYW